MPEIGGREVCPECRSGRLSVEPGLNGRRCTRCNAVIE